MYPFFLFLLTSHSFPPSLSLPHGHGHPLPLRLSRPSHHQQNLPAASCRLNLFGSVDGDMFNWESVPTAPGVIVGLGRVSKGMYDGLEGSDVANLKERASIYISLDSGRSWTNSLNGPTLFSLSFLTSHDQVRLSLSCRRMVR